jgi:hypothetical protein
MLSRGGSRRPWPSGKCGIVFREIGVRSDDRR